MVIGISKIFTSIIGVIIGGALSKIEIDGPNGNETFQIPTGAVVFEKLLEIGTGVLIFLQGKIALNACE